MSGNFTIVVKMDAEYALIGSLSENQMIKHLKRHQLAYTVAAIVAALLLVPMILFVTPLLADEAYYESWEQSRTDAREVSWVQEPALHQFKMFVSPH